MWQISSKNKTPNFSINFQVEINVPNKTFICFTWKKFEEKKLKFRILDLLHCMTRIMEEAESIERERERVRRVPAVSVDLCAKDHSLA